MKRSLYLLLPFLLLAACGGKENPSTKPDEPETPVVVEPPSGLALVEATDQSLTFSWSAVRDISVYAWSLSLDGTEATVQVRATLTLQDLTGVDIGQRVLRLSRESGLWKISLEQLEGLMEVAQ